MDTKQIIHHALQIEKLNTERSYGNIMPLLADLDNACVVVEQLQTTEIVKVLYRVLKTCPDDCVKKTAKCLLSKWKKLYCHSLQTLQEKGGFKCTEDSKKGKLSHDVCLTDGSAGGDADDQVVSMQGVSLIGSSQQQTYEGGRERVRTTTDEGMSSLARAGHSPTAFTLHSLSEDPRPPAATGDSTPTSSNQLSAVRPAATGDSTPTSSNQLSAVRSKCVQLLLCALSPETPKPSEHREKAAELARDIEQHIHTLHPTNEAKYKACVRSKVANLRNPKSIHLRQGLLSGTLGTEAFARMSAEEMAGEELQRLREEYSSQGVSERQLPQGLEGTQTQKIRCKRCDATDCRVTQVSRGTLFLPAWVRSGGPDEDAMTFVTCSRCGEQWYHSGWICL